MVLAKRDPVFIIRKSGNQEFTGVFSCFPVFQIQTKHAQLPGLGLIIRKSGNQEFTGVFSCFPAFLIQKKTNSPPVYKNSWRYRDQFSQT
jgi:hypothetical protein